MGAKTSLCALVLSLAAATTIAITTPTYSRPREEQSSQQTNWYERKDNVYVEHGKLYVIDKHVSTQEDCQDRDQLSPAYENQLRFLADQAELIDRSNTRIEVTGAHLVKTYCDPIESHHRDGDPVNTYYVLWEFNPNNGAEITTDKGRDITQQLIQYVSGI